MTTDRDTPEWTAGFVWLALLNDGKEREQLGGMWLPERAFQFDAPAMIADFERLDRPALRPWLEGPDDRPDIRYAAIIEGAETIGGRLVEDRTVSRWMTLKYSGLKFWALAHYGPEILQPYELPE